MEGDPEGIVWIWQEAIKTKNFNPDDPKELYTTTLLKVVANTSSVHGEDPKVREWTRYASNKDEVAEYYLDF